MKFVLGIDTGGTYTDSVIMNMNNGKVVRKSKSLTTKEDLSIGICSCLDKLGDFPYEKIRLVSQSTTLATNAIVEGKGCRTGLILVDKNLKRSFPADMVFYVGGRMDIKGRVQMRLDNLALNKAIERMKGKVDSIAVSGYSSVRNPENELFIKDVILKQADMPVVCAHTLTPQLGFYERTITAVLNARLIPIISDWLSRIKESLAKYKINAPIMVVKSDGSYMQSSLAIKKPIDTILSGPAASACGGRFLNKIKNGIILDIGGTTTDIARINNGDIGLNEKGAIVGGWLTRIKSIKTETVGLGGDSIIILNKDNEFEIGPEKVIPFCLAGVWFPYLKEDIKRRINESEDGQWVYLSKSRNSRIYSSDEKQVVELLNNPCSVSLLINKHKISKSIVDKLIKNDVIKKIGLTPTDVIFAEKNYLSWDIESSKLIIGNLAKRINVCEEIVTHKIKNIFCSKIYNHIPNDTNIVAIGAPSQTWIKEINRRHKCNIIVPNHFEVANAIGAAMGQVTEIVSGLIRYDKITRKYTVYGPNLKQQANTLDIAKDVCKEMLHKAVSMAAESAGSNKYEVVIDIKDLKHKGVYIETKIIAMAFGDHWINNQPKS